MIGIGIEAYLTIPRRRGGAPLELSTILQLLHYSPQARGCSAYRKFLRGDPLIEAKTVTETLIERLPPKIHRIQAELPAWMRKTGSAEAAALMQILDDQLKAKNFEAAEKTADSLLKLMGERP